MSTRTALPEQASLFDPEPAPAPATKVKKPSNRHHTLDLPRPWAKHLPCAATCLTCRRPADLGTCTPCAIVCGRPDKTGPVEICLLALTLPARVTPSGRHALVTCPHCDNTHWHTPTPGRSYRVGQCGQPYIVHVPEVTS